MSNNKQQLIFRVIRIKRINVDCPAGEVFDFCGESVSECAKKVCNFLWGKDRENYLIIKFGNEIELESNDLNDIERQLLLS